MDGIAIASERLAAAGTGVGDVGRMLSREIATMGDLLGEIRTGWQSDQAAPRFAASLQTYLDQAAVLRDALISHGESLLGSGRAFAEAEAAVAGVVPGVS